MINIFSVSSDYNRTPLDYPPCGEPAYPRYYVRTAPNDDYRPLKEDEIFPEDLKFFKQKIFIAGAKWSEQQGKFAMLIACKLPV